MNEKLILFLNTVLTIGSLVIQSTKRINHRGDTLNNPTITFECSSPAVDILHLNAYHWKRQTPTMAAPDFELFPDSQGVSPAVSRSLESPYDLADEIS